MYAQEGVRSIQTAKFKIQNAVHIHKDASMTMLELLLYLIVLCTGWVVCHKAGYAPLWTFACTTWPVEGELVELRAK